MENSVLFAGAWVVNGEVAHLTIEYDHAWRKSQDSPLILFNYFNVKFLLGKSSKNGKRFTLSPVCWIILYFMINNGLFFYLSVSAHEIGRLPMKM